jgi:hypothetical protein
VGIGFILIIVHIHNHKQEFKSKQQSLNYIFCHCLTIKKVSMKQAINLYSKKILLSIFFFSVIALNSCRVTFIPSYDADISKQIENTAKAVDKFYLSMLEITSASNNGRAYNNFSEQYINIEVELNSLLNKNKIRPLNENSTRICEITIQLWMKYKEEHKSDNSLSDGLVKLNRKTFSDLFFAMQVAEKGKDIVSNPPQ